MHIMKGKKKFALNAILYLALAMLFGFATVFLSLILVITTADPFPINSDSIAIMVGAVVLIGALCVMTMFSAIQTMIEIHNLVVYKGESDYE